jgi:excisionase family DNA binding protein
MPKHSSEDSLLLTFNETAEHLRVDRSTVYRLVAEKRIPAPIRVGQSPRFLRSAIEQYVAEQAERAS